MPHQRFDDDQAHQLAERYLASVLGAAVIARRDDELEPIVMSESEWDACRRGHLANA